jgi:hypothetical protein
VSGSSPTPSADDKETASSNDKKKEQQKKRTQDVIIIIICILALVAFLLIAYLASSPEFETRNKMTTTIVDDIIDTPANYYTYYTFSVPAGASNARVTGNYEVHGGLIPRIDIYLADTTLCSSPIDCSSYYYVGKDKSFGEVDVYLPTSARSRQITYYLSFHNIAPLGESKQTEASFKLEIS